MNPLNLAKNQTKRAIGKLRGEYARWRGLSPFADDGPTPLIVHACYHRVGSGWFTGLLREIARPYGLRVEVADEAPKFAGADFVVDWHSRLDPYALAGEGRPVRGSHAIRDPRDMCVSGYHYHKWTSETWALTPPSQCKTDEHAGLKRFYQRVATPLDETSEDQRPWRELLPAPWPADRTYQQQLNALNESDGMMMELLFISHAAMPDLVGWDYNNPDFVEFRMEDIATREDEILRAVLSHYGFHGKAIESAMQVVAARSFRKATGRTVGQVQEKSHFRSGAKQQWRDAFEERHVSAFKRLHGADLIKLGYETDEAW